MENITSGLTKEKQSIVAVMGKKKKKKTERRCKLSSTMERHADTVLESKLTVSSTTLLR